MSHQHPVLYTDIHVIVLIQQNVQSQETAIFYFNPLASDQFQFHVDPVKSLVLDIVKKWQIWNDVHEMTNNISPYI